MDRDQSLYNSYEAKFLKNAIEKYKAHESEGFQDECLKLKSRATLEGHLERMLAEVLHKLKNSGGNAILENDEFNPL